MQAIASATKTHVLDDTGTAIILSCLSYHQAVIARSRLFPGRGIARDAFKGYPCRDLRHSQDRLRYFKRSCGSKDNPSALFLDVVNAVLNGRCGVRCSGWIGSPPKDILHPSLRGQKPCLRSISSGWN